MKYLGNPENDYPPRQEYAVILGIHVQTLYGHFTPADFQDIENEAYELRKKNSTKQRAMLLKALYVEGRGGNVSAIKEFLDRTEGKVLEKKDVKVSGALGLTHDIKKELKDRILDAAQ